MKAFLLSTLLAGVFSLPACTGVVNGGSGDSDAKPSSFSGGSTNTPGSDGTTGGAGATMPFQSDAEATTPTLARLSTLQWANSIRALLQLPNPGDLDNALTKDAVVRFDNEADSLFVGQALHDDLQAEAERVAELVSADPAAIARLVPVNAPTDSAARANAYIQDFGRKVYRRPLTTSEVQDYSTLFNQGPTLTTGMTAFAAGVRVTLEAFLQSPYFLYRTAFGGTAVQGKARLTGFEIAANLSYALTNAPPDPELSAAADRGMLDSAAIAEHAKRLMPTEQGKAAVDRFFFQYFGLGQYDTLQKDPAVAPQFTDATGPLLHQEAQQLLQYLFSENLGLREIFTTPVDFVNAPIAKLYGLSGSFSVDSWTQVSFDATQRPGILTRLGFLSYYAHQALQDTIHRGANINSRILCTELSPPPNIVIPALPAQDPSKTNRQLVSEFTETCGAACHLPYINPAGFAFENFDGLGNYRTTENGKPIDSSGEYSFQDGAKKFASLGEFTQLLAESSQAHGCYTKKWAENLYSRVPRRADENLAAALAQRSITEHLSSMDVVLALITDDAFVTRVEGSP